MKHTTWLVFSERRTHSKQAQLHINIISTKIQKSAAHTYTLLSVISPCEVSIILARTLCKGYLDFGITFILFL